MDIFEKIIGILRDKGVGFELFEHEKVIGSQDAAKIRGTRLEEAAKAIVLQVKTGEIIMCVVPGDKRIDLNLLKKNTGFRKISLASPEAVLNATGCTVGSVPPFGSLLFKMPMYVDPIFREKDFIVFSAGSHYKSIRMKAGDYLKVVDAEFLDFVKNIE